MTITSASFIPFSHLSMLTLPALVASIPAHALQKAYFAGGCFWCMEAPFEKQSGVISAISGYAGGEEKSPSYKDVSAGRTGHAEAIEITFDESKITYRQLLEIFWRQIDPTDDGGQFVDRGRQYRSEIFYVGEQQRAQAEQSKRELEQKNVFKKPIKTKITPFSTFYSAEDYHQDYYKKNPIRYRYYRYRSGRDQFLRKVWGV